ncbi:hypothetical protein PGB90_007138 [Kerria lacca]
MSAFQFEFKKEPTTNGLNDLFDNSEKGCEWYALADDLTNEVHGLGIDDLHSVTAQLLSSQTLSSSDETSLSMDDPLHYPSLIQGLDVIQETCESSSLDEGDGDIETETLTETTPEEIVTSEHDNINLNLKNRRLLTNAPNMRRLILSTAASTSESNNSDSSIQSYTYGQGKKKGGWPKGRKRKPPDLSEIKPPKAPSTGYVLYLIDKRKHYKNLPFHEVTKLLGNEWTKLDKSQKKFYLDKAEIDKKRYREELRVYRKSEAYQTYLRWKRLKRRPNGTEESDFDATDEIEEEDNEELYCKACDQWFVTFHNKKEHLYGKQHLGSLRGTNTNNDNSSSYSFDESSLDAAPLLSPRRNGNVNPAENLEPSLLNVTDSMVALMKNFSERESEIGYLKYRIESAQEKQEKLNILISELKDRKKQLTKITSTMKEEEKRFQKSMSKFWSIISMFITMSYSSLIYKNVPELIKQTETIINAHSKVTPFIHFGIRPETDDEENNGRTLIFRFVSLSKFENSNLLPFNVQQNQLTTALKLSYPYGVILQSKEKTAVYPVVQFYYENSYTHIRNEDYLIQDYSCQSCLYKEVRYIEPEMENNPGYTFNPYYIILGFKTANTQVLLDSWKDWTGARYIYINFPQQLRLRKIILYHKETNEDVNLFSYVVIVKCDGIDTKEKQITLLDFVQRLRAERTSNFISVYDEVIK